MRVEKEESNSSKLMGSVGTNIFLLEMYTSSNRDAVFQVLFCGRYMFFPGKV